jgi:hypothetical protein
MEPGQQEEFPVKQFLSYLEYRGCDLGVTFPADITFVTNPRNGEEAQVPIARFMITAYMMYWVCLELGVNMPDEFAAYQQLMDGAKPAGYPAR